MRISDWSSDVCSSDLVGVEVQQRRHGRGRYRPSPPAPISGGRSGGVDGDRGVLGQDLLALAVPEHDLVEEEELRHPEHAEAAEEIGRASCRERVWQYV